MFLQGTSEARGLINRWRNSVLGATSYYEQDGLGSVTSLSNGAGAVTETYTYDTYGKPTASTGVLVNPFQYTGREFDSETGIYYYRARYFDPSVGRFLNQDPIRFGGGTNFYAYTQNRPADLTDPWGFQAQSSTIGSMYLGPDGVWYNDGPLLPSDLPSGCSPAQWAQSPNACAGAQGQNEPDPVYFAG
jgi:RHS repeat-associated protein